ncbi:MAG: hypothetical protein BRD55_08215 [Bacteroidetes bacterium SW_9_63_38]|nr:MAG: hypothetical protein BRD55_08215 [Bacteroidetes bacterium SW_9_63_38]
MIGMAAATPPAPPSSIAHRVVNNEPVSIEEYRTFQEEEEGRYEYVDGWIVSMTAASWSHSVIASNIDRTLGNQLHKTDCRTASRDVEVELPTSASNAFPDVVVVCGDPKFADERALRLRNPSVVVEVLSPSTMDYDRGEKFARYRQLDTLQEYLLVAQDRPHVEHYVRQEDSWRFTETDGLDAEIDLPSLDATLPLSEIYLDVSFDSDENE